MSMTPRFIRPLAAAAAALVCAAGIAGCGPDLQGLCESVEECRGGNEADIDACVAAQEYDGEAADIEGCTDEYEAFFQCFYDTAECNTDDTGMACTMTKECTEAGYSLCKDGTCRVKVFGLSDPDDCKAERNAYDKCQ